MSLFDSIISEADERFGLGNKAGSLLSALLALMTDKNRGGFAGFLDLFNNAGLSDIASSWVNSGANTSLSNEQLESALGEDTIGEIAAQADVDKPTATSTLAYMVPKVVDTLTPNGVVPDETDLLSRIGSHLSGLGGAITGGIGAAGIAASGAFDRIGTAADTTVDKGKTVVGDGVDSIGDSTRNIGGGASAAINRVDDSIDEDSKSSVLNWLLPLILLALAVILGYWFCGKSSVPTVPANTNMNTNKAAATNVNTSAKAVDSSFRLEAKDGKYTVTGVVKDEATKKQIMDSLIAQFGDDNVNFDGLKIDAAARDFGTGWWANFSQMLPSLKDWKTGVLGFTGSAIIEVAGLPQAAIDQLKVLFGTGWKLPFSLAGAETAAKQANEEALKELVEADSVDEIVKALNISIINFASGKADIPADAKPIIDKAAEVLKKQPAGTLVEIGGHTDSDGDDAANVKLSQARADSVKKALVALGVTEAMLTTKGYGETASIAANDTPDNKFKNRRIEYKTGSGSSPTATTITTNTNSTK